MDQLECGSATDGGLADPGRIDIARKHTEGFTSHRLWGSALGHLGGREMRYEPTFSNGNPGGTFLVRLLSFDSSGETNQLLDGQGSDQLGDAVEH
jgi:hypothetical protein